MPVVAVAVLAFAGGAAAGYLAILRVVAPRSRGDRRRALLWGGAGVAVVVLQLAWWVSIGSERPEPTPYDRLPTVAVLDVRKEEDRLALMLRLERPPSAPAEVAFEGRISGRDEPLFDLRDTLPAGHAGDWRREVPHALLRERARAILLEPGFAGSAAADVVITVEGSVRVPGDRHPVHARRSTEEHAFRF